MSDPYIPTCAICGRELPIRGETRGRPRQYCGATCRKRAERARRAESRLAQRAAEQDPAARERLEAAIAARPPRRPNVSTDEQVTRTILEARGVAGSLLLLGREARPPLAWRAIKLSEAIHGALDVLSHDVIDQVRACPYR